MDPNTRAMIFGAAGVSGAAATYVEDVFSTWLYTGNGSTQTITNGIDLAGKGGLVWLKDRVNSNRHGFTDTARSATYLISSNLTNAESQFVNTLTSFSSTGFSIGSDALFNNNTGSYASWTFRKAAKFFDVVTYTGNGTNRTIAHNLGSVPGCIIVKRTDTAADWQVYHRSLANTEYLVLNNAAAKAPGATRWNSTTPTSSVFSLGTDVTVNANGGTYVAYLFAHDAGGFGDAGTDSVVSCGSFTIDGAGAATINLGWEPQWVLVKRSSGTSSDANDQWQIFDTMRGWQAVIAADQTSPEASTNTSIRPSATGFYCQGMPNAPQIYIAIRRGPMKTPTDATKVFAASLGAATTPAFTSNFPIDLALTSYRSGGGGNNYVVDRLRGQTALETPSTAVEGAVIALWKLDQQTGFAQSSGGWGSTHVCSMFRRAPGFFDVVAYTGTGAALTVNHNLGVVPELIIVKSRNFGTGWATWTTALGLNGHLFLSSTNASQTLTDYWSGLPSSTSFSVSSVGFGDNNGNNRRYIAYLFASCPGVSKVGSYTGTGTTLQVNCGFTNGARFVLIKRTDNTGDWYVWDTARGIIAANDPYLLLNSTAAEITNTDYIDPYSAGFEISSTAPAAINANGGTYIYLAIA